jgi:putative transposase
MDRGTLKTKWRWSADYTVRTICEACKDVWGHYFSTYPFLIILGAIRRLRRRLKNIWLPKSPGRPPVDEAIVDLILEMKRENQGWGGQRISDELALLGVIISKKTVLKILKENGLVPPKKKFTPPSWRSLFDCYSRIWGIDFTTVFDVKGNQLFIFNILDWSTRKLIISTPTMNPTRAWISQQFRNAAIETRDIFPHAIVRDNDALFKDWLDPFMKEFHVIPILIDPHCPWQNGRTERVQKSEKDEVLRRMPIVDVQHCAELNSLYKMHYNVQRPHQAINGRPPENGGSSNFSGISGRKIVKKREVNGLITRFVFEAA